MPEELEKTSKQIESKVKNMQGNSLLGKIKKLKNCILIDCSGSMSDWLPGDKSCNNRYKVVNKVYKENLKHLEMRIFWFNDDFGEIERGKIQPNSGWYGEDPSEIPYPSTGTDMTNAFYRMKDLGVERCIIVTDGQPNEPDTALEAAKGIQFDIVYIGEPPVPDFLLKLGNIKGNSFTRVDMLKPNSFGELTGKIKGLLNAGK
jgi:hypothetical protein